MQTERTHRRLALALVALATMILASSAHASAAPGDPLIIGGTTAPPGVAPYVAYVRAEPGDGFVYSCTGALIAPQYILTAGHCAYDEDGDAMQPSSYEVAIGASDFEQATPDQVRDVAAVNVYPYFDPATLQGDATILTLDAPTGAGTQPIPLATPAQAALYGAGQQAAIMGYGTTSNGGDVTNLLQVAADTVQANATCAAVPTGIGFHPGFDLCTANPGFAPSTCHGDSGGPLVVTTASGPVEIGITSYGSSGICGTGPDFFTRASSIEGWAASVIAGAPAPPPFVPPFAPTTPTAALDDDGITSSFAAPAVDPATLATGFSATLTSSAGAIVATQDLPLGATTAAFPHLQPGTYTVSVTATYSEGASAPVVSAPVTLAPPTNGKRPALAGTGIVGSKLSCSTGTWSWPGPFTLARAWLRGGKPTGKSAPTYTLTTADAGKRIACRVTQTASTGSAGVATSASVLATVKLAPLKAARLAGHPTVGSTLTCRAGTWRHSGTIRIAYRWLRNGRPIYGPLGAVLERTVTAADAAHRLACRVTATASGQTATQTTAGLLIG